jgi:hypothetical protein
MPVFWHTGPYRPMELTFEQKGCTERIFTCNAVLIKKRYFNLNITFKTVEHPSLHVTGRVFTIPTSGFLPLTVCLWVQLGKITLPPPPHPPPAGGGGGGMHETRFHAIKAAAPLSYAWIYLSTTEPVKNRQYMYSTRYTTEIQTIE